MSDQHRQTSMFDEPPQTPSFSAVLSVTALNRYVADGLRADPLLQSVRLRGQISGFKPAASGHWYFTLRDEECAVDCVLFRQHAQRAGFRPVNGDQVILHGSVGLYSVTGRYQFYADSIRPEGTGLLWQRFEALKERLQAEGLFDAARKRPLPVRPRKIAVVTSESGAVLHDICHVAGARDPGTAIVLVPVAVQGAAAAEEIAQGIRLAGEIPGVEALIVGRGGGSMEDLWCFNEECVARAIAACPVPVVSAVGHETDFTIADFVADIRAATPSNAAELLVADQRTTLDAVLLAAHRLEQAALQSLAGRSAALNQLRQALQTVRPDTALERRQTQLRQLWERLRIAGLARVRAELPAQAMAALRLDSAMDACIERQSARLAHAAARLEALSPARVLDRGYALAMDGSHVIISAKAAPERFTLRFADGNLPVRKDSED